MIVQHDGLYWPESDRAARPVIVGDCDASIRQLLTHVRGRDCIVQAGANVGTYPLALADHFKKVVTVEPDAENFECLRLNLKARDSLGRVHALNAALGQAEGYCHIVQVEPNNCGAHRIEEGGPIHVVAIDSFCLEACDAIWLDVEGYELPALKGAVETIEAFSPVIAVEEKGLEKAFGVQPGELTNWLGLFGYEQVDRIGRDKVFRRHP